MSFLPCVSACCYTLTAQDFSQVLKHFSSCGSHLMAALCSPELLLHSDVCVQLWCFKVRAEPFQEDCTSVVETGISLSIYLSDLKTNTCFLSVKKDKLILKKKKKILLLSFCPVGPGPKLSHKPLHDPRWIYIVPEGVDENLTWPNRFWWGSEAAVIFVHTLSMSWYSHPSF